MTKKNHQDRERPPPNHQKELVKMIDALGYRHSKWQVFSDFVEMAALSISNAVDIAQREKREARYMEVIKRYTAEETQQFPKMLGLLVMALDEKPDDVLGRVFHDLELHNKYTGQFFTPYDLCRMMAKMTIGDPADLTARIEEGGFITASEPACGAGAMVIALAEEMKAAGINYQRQLHVTAVDIDPKCVHMAYLQFSLLHIPAVIVHGNSLSLEEFGHWYTPAHILEGWNWRLRNRAKVPTEPIRTVEPVTEPPRPDAPKPAQLTLF